MARTTSTRSALPSFTFFRLIRFFLLARVALTAESSIGQQDDVKVASNECAWSNDDDASCSEKQQRPPLSPSCRIVMAPSKLHGYGIFTLTELRRGQSILPGDVVVHLSDMLPTIPISFAASQYWWSASDSGGYYEGKEVASVAPGVGMLANGAVSEHNVLPAVPKVDEAGLTRTSSPGSGAVTAYHNWTWFVQSKVLPAGREVLVNYGKKWFEERQLHNLLDLGNSSAEEDPPARSVQELREEGWCLDNLKAGRSALRDAGRGAFATRHLPEGVVVAPVPVLPILRESLLIAREDIATGKAVFTQQLLLNYCWGHPDSSLLFYSYGPLVNLINHSGGKRANVRLQWVDAVEDNNTTIVEALPRTWMLELIAIRPIRENEEVVLDYGLPWIEAWLDHVKGWRPHTDDYAPSYVLNDAIQVLRTEEELKSHPYPPNVFTSCYYRYADDKEQAERQQQQQKDAGTTAFRWQMRRGLFEPRHLRPCRILQRQEDNDMLEFTVQIRNRYGLDPRERIPSGNVHILTHVPRHAIAFSDKLYTTDQHLRNAFRHPMGNLEYPEQWKDRAKLKQQDGDHDTR